MVTMYKKTSINKPNLMNSSHTVFFSHVITVRLGLVVTVVTAGNISRDRISTERQFQTKY